MEEDKTIKKELAKLKKIFADIPKDKQSLCESLMQNAAFMHSTLLKLQEQIIETGAIVTMINGNGFEVTQESAAQKSYNTMINRYSSVIKLLGDMLPDDKQNNVTKAGESLAAFIVKGK